MKLHDLAFEHVNEKLREVQNQHQYTTKRFFHFQEQLNHLGKQYQRDVIKTNDYAISSMKINHKKWPASPTLFSYQDKDYYGYWLWLLSEKGHITSKGVITVPVEQADDMIILISELHEMYSNLQQQEKIIRKYKTTLTHMKELQDHQHEYQRKIS